MKTAIATALLFLLLLAPAHGHPSCAIHVRDYKMVLNGYGDTRFKELAENISTKMDTFQKRLGVNLGADHRLFCHGWTLNDSIPKAVFEELERRAPGKRGEFIQAWKDFAGEINTLAVEKTGLPKAQAKALASLLYDLHLLGDFEPDNSELRYVLHPRAVVENIDKDVETLFLNRPEYAKEVRNTLQSVLKE